MVSRDADVTKYPSESPTDSLSSRDDDRVLEQLIGEFHRFEVETGAVRREVAGVMLWNLIRTFVFNDIARSRGLFGRLHHTPKKQYWQRFSAARRDAKLLLQRYQPFPLEPRPVLLMNHARHYQLEGKLVSPYTHHLFERFPWPYWNLQFSNTGTHALEDGEHNVRYLDALYQLGTKAVAVRYRWSSMRGALREAAAKLADEITRAFSIVYPAARVDELYWNAFRIERGWGRIADWILDQVRPRLLVNVVHYSFPNQVMTMRARRRGIPVAELQHGAVTKEHIAYHYADGAVPPSAPDYFLAFGSYWNHVAQGLSLPEERVVAIGFAWFEDQLRRTAHRGRQDKSPSRRLLVLSQSSIGQELSRFVVEAAPPLRERGFQICYRLHPGEVSGWQERMPWLAASGIEVSRGEVSLYEAFANADVQLGVYSTAVFEGVAFGLRTVVARLPGSGGLTDLVNTGGAHFADTPEELVQLLSRELPVHPELRSRLWQPDAIANFERFVAARLFESSPHPHHHHRRPIGR